MLVRFALAVRAIAHKNPKMRVRLANLASNPNEPLLQVLGNKYLLLPKSLFIFLLLNKVIVV